VKIQSDQQDVAAAEDDAVFYAILRGVSRPVESTVRPRSSKAHAASRNTSALIQ
jgi:hypothetical protein